MDTSLTAGSVVRPVGLIATPWANVFNGQVQQGVAYRAESLAIAPASGMTALAAATTPKAVKS
ncbi:hypothetical protein C7C46_32890 [Streptomyces tateyamensis]|uniref:Uncharacterized protein n=1 Tax=Streptomyces tateyamensis TaxID=565073 RepID=A0A2V4MSB8_9ACTN|nr:hypothetical protein [Streptomyces tateyamensis]PYC64748.1 hypothetical protein C7C46_32890 [Streptomyces tateyamensis]